MLKKTIPFFLVLFGLPLSVQVGCKPNAAPAKKMWLSAAGAQELPADASPAKAPGVVALDAHFDDRLHLVGIKAPREVKAGQKVDITLFVEVKQSIFDSDLKVFIHGQAKGAELSQAGADHPPISGAVAPAEWNAGDLLEDTFTLVVPPNFPGDTLQLFGGFYVGNKRYPVKPASAHDGNNRVLLATLKVDGSAQKLAKARAMKKQGPLVIDGVLDEASWARAERVGPFIAYNGTSIIRNSTHARLLWDDDNLYVAFECDDPDIHTPYKKRDDPLYNSEAVEIFIDADGDKDEYVELQAAPNGLRFDAAFKGGRRKNFDTSYNVNYEVKNKLDGTLNDPSDKDKGWVSEWRIPISELRDIPAPPKVGDKWQINLFRLDRIRRNGKVVGSEAAAWSSPLSGDFHNLDRFGTLEFAE